MLKPAHRDQLRKRGFSDAMIDEFAGEQVGDWLVRSLSAAEIQANYLDAFPSMRGSSSDALLLRFNETTLSLRPDNLVVNGEQKKYLYVKSDQPGKNTQPWIPPGNPVIATEGLFDALASTLLMNTPCCAATAPSHLGRSRFPSSVKIYVSDADVPFHHAESLLAMVVGYCRERGLKLAHMPRNPAANYVFTDKIPDDCKWGMEEWARVWGSQAKENLEQLINDAKDPVSYLSSLFNEYKAIGLRYPENQVTIANGARAIADATTRGHERYVLRDLLKKCTGAPKGWLAGIIQKRIENISRNSGPLACSSSAGQSVALPSIRKANPTKADLQRYLSGKYTLRFNELTQLVELNGEPMNDQIEHADQFLAMVDDIEVGK